MKKLTFALIAVALGCLFLAIAYESLDGFFVQYRPVYRVLKDDWSIDSPWEFAYMDVYLTDDQAKRTCEVLARHGERFFRIWNRIYITKKLYCNTELLWGYTCEAHKSDSSPACQPPPSLRP